MATVLVTTTGKTRCLHCGYVFRGNAKTALVVMKYHHLTNGWTKESLDLDYEDIVYARINHLMPDLADIYRQAQQLDPWPGDDYVVAPA